MRISDDERREVAENLRNLTIGHSIQYKERFFDELAEVWDDETKQHYLDCTACHFGRLSIELDDVGMRFNSRALWAGVDYTSLTHCPYCGADVER